MTAKSSVSELNDELRSAILKYFYDKRKSARSLKGSKLKISEIKTDLKKVGMDERTIASNLDYLIQTDWIIEDTETYQITTKGRVINASRQFYKISDKGIDYFEGASKFRKSNPFSGINITNIQGVMVLGDGNVVNARYGDLYRNLNTLSGELTKSGFFTDEEKLNLVSEIETIKSQLSKTSPDKNIVSRAWEKLKPLATVAGIANFLEKTEVLIRILLGA